MHYYEDRLTGSIYNSNEIARMVRRKELTLAEVPARFKGLKICHQPAAGSGGIDRRARGTGSGSDRVHPLELKGDPEMAEQPGDKAAIRCDELGCGELVDLAEGYFGLQLPDEEQARFEAHLDSCRPCRSYLKQVCRTIGTGGELPAGGIPPDVRKKLVTALQERRSRVGLGQQEAGAARHGAA